MKQKEEERRKEEPAAEAAVVTMKRAEIAEAKIVDEQAEAARPAKDEWRAREEAELYRVLWRTAVKENARRPAPCRKVGSSVRVAGQE